MRLAPRQFAPLALLHLLLLSSLLLSSLAADAQPTCRPAPTPAACEADTDCSTGQICSDVFVCESACPDGALAPIYFSFDEARIPLDQQSTVELDALCIRAWRDRTVVIVGHTAQVDTVDELGNPTGLTEGFALAVSERRALAVAGALADLGVDASQMTVLARGSSQPFCVAPTELCDERNQRVELHWR